MLSALTELIFIVGNAWLLGGPGCGEPAPTAVQRLRTGLPFFVMGTAKTFGVSPAEVWVKFGKSLVFAVSWLALGYFLLRHRPWARTALLVVLAVGALSDAALAIVGAMQTGAPVFTLEPVLFMAVLLFVFTRKGVVALYRRRIEA